MEHIPCQFKNTNQCSVYRLGGECFEDIHHKFHPKKDYPQGVQSRFRNLDENKQLICRDLHNLEHVLFQPPDKPDIEIMRMAIEEDNTRRKIELRKRNQAMREQLERQTVAIDIDDVLLDTAPAILSYYEREYGISIPIEEFYTREAAVWGVEEYRLATERIGQYLMSPEFNSTPPYPEALVAVRALASKNKLVAVTGRQSIQRGVTEEWLDKHFNGMFADLRTTDHFNDKRVAKGDVCKEIKASWLIDDHIDHLRTLGSCGVKGLLFGNRPWGRGHDLPENVFEAPTWEDVLQKINQ